MNDEICEANQRYVENFDLGELSNRASKGLAVVTCIDTRIDPLSVLGLRPGEAKILRNAGGRVTADVLRSLVLATTLLNVNSVAIMHHTECALSGQTEEGVRSLLSPYQNSTTSSWEFLAMPDPDVALAEDVNAVLACAAFPDRLVVEGWRYDVRTGVVHEIVPAR